MPDTKITALAAITTVDPAADVLPIVDISDTSMAASGTTKKITSNQILGAGGTATLASATITGDLTVDTSTLKVDSANNRVGIGTASPLFPLDIISSGATTVAVRSTGAVGLFRGYAITDGTTEYGQFKQSLSTGELQIVSGNAGWGGLLTISTGGSERYRIASDGVATWSNVGGVAGTAMTLNATGLGVGVTPIERLTVAGTASVGGTGNIGVKFHSGSPVAGNLAWLLSNDSTNSNILNLYYYNAGVFSGRAFVVNQSGNFMVRTPSTPPTIPDNEMMVFNLTSNTNLRISVKGADGTTRTANITLA